MILACIRSVFVVDVALRRVRYSSPTFCYGHPRTVWCGTTQVTAIHDVDKVLSHAMDLPTEPRAQKDSERFDMDDIRSIE